MSAPCGAGSLLIEFVRGDVVSEGIPDAEAEAWAEDLWQLGAAGRDVRSWNEYVFTGRKPASM